VVGAAGYIGSHIVRVLTSRGENVVAVDDLSTGRADRLGQVPLHAIDVAAPGSATALERLMERTAVDSVIHLAAKKQVGESTRDPLLYYAHNIDALANVVSAVSSVGVPRVVFSSTAAVYGETAETAVAEESSTTPINPYGRSKLVGEWLLADTARAKGFRAASLRFFNVAGASDAKLADPGVTNLVPIVVEAALNGRPVQIFGDDYPTPDGTCVRDYVHVEDVASAHVAALDHLTGAGDPHRVFNIGGGAGSSVRDVISAVEAASGRQVEARVGPRRDGDPASVVASVARANTEIGWAAHFSLSEIVSSEWAARA